MLNVSGVGRAWRTGIFAVLIGLLLGCDQQGDTAANAPTPIANPAPDAAPKLGSPKLDRNTGVIPAGTGFDFYVLSLSWSPSYCEAEGAGANRQQCASGRPYAFVVHGLWPQFEHGFPSKCPTDQSRVEDPLLQSLYDLMPSAGLIGHEWREHGACSGLSQADYFHVLRQARERIVIPAEFRRLTQYRTLAPREAEQSFLKANAGLNPDQIAVTCDKRYLRDVRICMTKQLGFRDCPEIDRRACAIDKVVMPPLRGG